MAEFVQQTRPPERRPDREQVDDMPVAKAAGEAAVESSIDTEALDELLDEIDELLETNPIDFVQGFKQRGGE